MTKVLNRIFSVAPMMEWTDTHYRALVRIITARIITKHALLYTEMIPTPTLYYGNTPHKHLTYTPTLSLYSWTDLPIHYAKHGGMDGFFITRLQKR